MKKFTIKSLLRICKSPDRIYSLICNLVPLVFNSGLVMIIPTDKYDSVEKKLLLSAFIFHMSTRKDLRADFLDKYLKCFVNDICSNNTTEELIYLFENAVPGLSFGQTGTESERKQIVEDEMLSYLRHRLVDYRVFIDEYMSGNIDNLGVLFFLLSSKPFDTTCWHLYPYINYLCNEIECEGYDEMAFIRFKEVLTTLKDYYNLVTISRKTWMNNNPDREVFHTEGLLGILNIPLDSRFLAFNKIGGVGIIKCKHCSFSQKIVSFIHRDMSASIGRQCPQCGEFCVENNESKEYHTFGPSTHDCVCPKCKYIIRRMDESICKGNENPLFCPHCRSIDLQYKTQLLT